MGIFEDRVLEEQDIKENPQDYLWGIHKEQLIKDIIDLPFPGTKKWPADHPIWNCNIANKMSPKNAWGDYIMLSKAVDNLYYITQKSLAEDKYEDFTDEIYKGFSLAYEKQDFNLLSCLLLNRFTVAKIAPKVTALMPSAFERILEECSIDISNGIYCPMAGFGGIIEGAKRVFKKLKKEPNIEAYDINANFCKYYGWINRDVLAQKIVTDKVVVACPPFGKETERWEGTPESMYYSFEEWCKLIKEQIKAPNYIFIGPERKDYKPNQKCGLFKKKYGIQWYPEYSNIV
ncbi:MAG: hypothetical protein NC222_06265 [Staphylococcus sp.]|nr:hypothetical protein [Staphylococcus sp.]